MELITTGRYKCRSTECQRPWQRSGGEAHICEGGEAQICEGAAMGRMKRSARGKRSHTKRHDCKRSESHSECASPKQHLVKYLGPLASLPPCSNPRKYQHHQQHQHHQRHRRCQRKHQHHGHPGLLSSRVMVKEAFQTPRFKEDLGQMLILARLLEAFEGTGQEVREIETPQEDPGRIPESACLILRRGEHTCGPEAPKKTVPTQRDITHLCTYVLA